MENCFLSRWSIQRWQWMMLQYVLTTRQRRKNKPRITYHGKEGSKLLGNLLCVITMMGRIRNGKYWFKKNNNLLKHCKIVPINSLQYVNRNEKGENDWLDPHQVRAGLKLIDSLFSAINKTTMNASIFECKVSLSALFIRQKSLGFPTESPALFLPGQQRLKMLWRFWLLV